MLSISLEDAEIPFAAVRGRPCPARDKKCPTSWDTKGGHCEGEEKLLLSQRNSVPLILFDYAKGPVPGMVLVWKAYACCGEQTWLWAVALS